MRSKQSFGTIEESALQKISELITKFHSLLLPKASSTSVYRDLSEQEQMLLENLSSDCLIHSILAGTLAIDSCLENIYESQEMLKNGIIKNFFSLLVNYRKIENILDESVCQKQRVKMQKSIYENMAFIYHYLSQYPTTYPEPKLSKIKLILDDLNTNTINSSSINHQQDRTIPILTFSNDDQTPEISCILMENRELREKLNIADSKIAQMEVNLMKIAQQNVSQNRNSDERNEEPMNRQKESNIEGESLKQKINELHKEIKGLNLIIEELKFEKKMLLKDHYQQKKQLYINIEKLEDQISYLEKNSDPQLLNLIGELQLQLDRIREERRNDERIMMSIQNKFTHMRASRGIRDPRQYRDLRNTREISPSYMMEHSHIRQSQSYPIQRSERTNSFLRQKKLNPSAFYSHRGLNSYNMDPDIYHDMSRKSLINKRSLSRSRGGNSSSSPRFKQIQENGKHNVNKRQKIQKKGGKGKVMNMKPRVYFDETFMPNEGKTQRSKKEVRAYRK